MYENWKLKKSEIDEHRDEYSEVVHWCRENPQYTINDNGEYFEVALNTPPTAEYLQSQVRIIRDSYLQQYDFTQLTDAPFTAEQKAQYAEYRQYLRDYTKAENWWTDNPKTFEEWSAE